LVIVRDIHPEIFIDIVITAEAGNQGEDVISIPIYRERDLHSLRSAQHKTILRFLAEKMLEMTIYVVCARGNGGFGPLIYSVPGVNPGAIIEL